MVSRIAQNVYLGKHRHQEAQTGAFLHVPTRLVQQSQIHCPGYTPQPHSLFAHSSGRQEGGNRTRETARTTTAVKGNPSYGNDSYNNKDINDSKTRREAPAEAKRAARRPRAETAETP